MTVKKTATALSRRTFLAAGSALAAIPLLHTPAARALGRNDTVSISDYNRNDWPAAFKQAFADGQTVEVPAGVVCDNINTGIFIPAGKTLLVRGALKGNGRGRFVLQDGSRVVGEKGGNFYNITLDVRGSDCVIKGVSMSGFGPVMQIYIGGKDARTMRNLVIDNITVSKANYGILRQGFHNELDGVRITNGHFSDLQGDAIEWNVAINDRNILISDHVIDNINCTNGKINWGIGIGLAGSTYDNNYPEDQAVKNFVVANITGSNCRQLVHVENGKHFIIRNVKAKNITPDFSKKAGIDNATVAIYGCDNFVIDNVSMVNSAGMLIGYGVIKGDYLSIPQNFKLNDIQQDNRSSKYKLRGIQISSGNATSFVAITNVKMQSATLELHNKPQHLFLRNINVTQEAANGPALKLNFDLRKDVRGRFMAKQDTLLSLANIHAVNENGQSSVDIDRVDQHVVNVDNLNFRLPAKRL
ncbi:colanic acid biosynthesis protein WcaM [Kosakonia sp. YIM B13605]|uniref:colanic acid biosynthesis protein WcaM n=1 Tax=Kosakonia TaxID=1330547 RepID=UPI0028AC51D5|nr:colanic acid biosynthesis protein WcaM [Kosakonia sacchari]